MKYAIIENEYFARDHLEEIVSKIRPEYSLVFTGESIKDSVFFFKSAPDVQLVFMDIELVDGICFEIFPQVDVEVPIIFTTAYDQFAIEAFSVNSIDYLLKPISEEIILKALNKLEKNYYKKNNNELYTNLDKALSLKNKRNRILVSSNENYVSIKVEDIAYFISEDKYVLLVTFSGKRFVTNYSTLNHIEEEIPANLFFRVSRNVILNINAITQTSKYFGNRLKVYFLKNNNEDLSVLISSTRKDSFLKWLNGESNHR